MTTFVPIGGGGVKLLRREGWNSEMCGICGFAYMDATRPASGTRLARMHGVIAHRGPDGVGEHVRDNVALGHRRLSVIDLEGGRQPLANEDGTVWVTFNGEIYNFRALMAELRARGHRFATRCDTEVLVHAYEEYGLDFVRRLDGMFAFALHDVRRRRVVLARDHLGVKPLFYAITDDGLFFGSEIKAVLAGSGQPANLQRAALQEYLLFRYTAGSRSFFTGVHRLPPAHLAVWEDGRLNLTRYWSIPRPATSGTTASLREAEERLDSLLGQAVRSQMMSDVPLGTFCSGGIDSGLVTAHAAEAGAATLHTFSVGFEDSRWDETQLARTTSSRYRTIHHVLQSRAYRVAELLPALIRQQDEPLSHPNSIPLFELSRLARTHVTVVLTGEGADELFCGYPRYRIARLHHRLASLGLGAPSLAASILRLVPHRRASLLARLLPRRLEDGLVLNSSYVDPELVIALTGSSLDEALEGRRRLLEEELEPGDVIGSLSRYELLTYLGCALDRMDRMSMAVGLEGRVPFLDVALVEWASRLRATMKLHRGTTKLLLKRIGRARLGDRLALGPKSGFGLPLADWFRGPLRSLVASRLRDGDHPAAELFDRAVVARLHDEHERGRADHGQALWLLLNIYIWHEIAADPPVGHADPIRIHDVIGQTSPIHA